MKKASQKALKIGAGVATAAVLAMAAGAYFLSGKEGKRRQAKMKAWAVKARKEVAKNVKMARRLSESQYKHIVDRAAKKYGSLADMSANDIMRAAKDMKAEWKNVQKHAQMMAKQMAPKKKPAARKKRI